MCLSVAWASECACPLALGTRFYSQALEGFSVFHALGCMKWKLYSTGIPGILKQHREHTKALESPISNEANGNW